MAEVLKLLARAAPRWGLMVLALLFGAALMGTAWRARRDAQAAEEVMVRAQGEALVQRMRRELGPRDRADPASLAAIVEAYEELGLRYLGVRENGRIVAEAGDARLAGVWPATGQLVSSGDRYRFRLSPRPRRPPRAHGPGFRHGPPPERRGPAPERPGPPPEPPDWVELVIEFEAPGAREIRQRGLVGLGVASGATLLLMGAAVVLSLLVRRSQLMQGELDRQRHLATLGEMSAVLAHEIRNPLASLKGHAQLLGEEVAPGKQRARVDRVVDEAVRLERLTNDLLAFARSAAIERVPVSPGEVLAAAAATLPAGRVTLDLSRAPDRFPLDAARMQRALANVLDNAAEVSPRPVEAAVTIEADRLVFTIRDHGPGVPAEDRDRIFEAFVTGKGHGTGLGLAVARRIVVLHGGRLDVGDAPGGGALFRAEIPRG